MSTELDAARVLTPSTPGRLTTRLQFTLAAVYFLAVGVALGRAAQFSGRLYIPHQGDRYTGNADLWPGGLAAVWPALIVVMTAVPLLTGLTAVVAVAQLTTARLRADRARWRLLLASTVLSGLVLAASLTAQAQLVLGWLLD
ncbi:hypothetical protein [Catellatospora sichuanensis]|uniref:hypothetical protein n=1 Tax=Catellatospora sichuanensis TaxID=1969805 RepID=UPI0011829C11|nr:hypothetical protein [Catellatospora sichuanensis]